jgi:hypothetical protein
MNKDTFSTRHPVWTAILTLPAVVLVIAAVGGCASEDQPVGKSTASDATGSASKAKTSPVNPPEENTAPERENRNPDGTFRSNCDLDLPSDIDGDYGLFATTKLKNTGNVGIKVRVVAVFDQATSDDLKIRKSVRIPVHHSRTVKMRIPITQDQADQFQSSPDYFNDKACRVHTTIVDSFGQPPLEDS